MKFGQNHISGLGGDVVLRLWTDRQTTTATTPMKMADEESKN